MEGIPEDFRVRRCSTKWSCMPDAVSARRHGATSGGILGVAAAALVVCIALSVPVQAESPNLSAYKDLPAAVDDRGAEEQRGLHASEPPADIVGSVRIEPASGESPPAIDGEQYYWDPFEPFNRAMFGFNDAVDVVVLRPAARAYRFVVPTIVRRGVSNFIANATSPVTLVNDVLQGKGDEAETTLVRFLVNSTVGFAGFVDVAEKAGLAPHNRDFDQTLAVYGVAPGPYLVLPVLGPATPRHVVGIVVDTAATPHTWILWNEPLLERASPTMAEIVTGREAALDEIDSLRNTSPDYYAAVRDLYFQHREAKARDGQVNIEDLPDISDLTE